MNQVRIGQHVIHLSTNIEGVIGNQHGDIVTVFYKNERDMPEFSFYGGYSKVDRFITHIKNITTA